MIRIDQALDRSVYIGSDYKKYCLLILMIINIIYNDQYV
jgi:hypothetical protein